MEKQTKRTYCLFLAFIVFTLLHNFVSGLLEGEEAVFFLLAVLLFLLFMVSVVINLITFFSKEIPSDIWKLGFVGILGVSAFISWPPRLPFFFFFFFLLFFLARPKRKTEEGDYSGRL